MGAVLAASLCRIPSCSPSLAKFLRQLQNGQNAAEPSSAGELCRSGHVSALLFPLVVPWLHFVSCRGCLGPHSKADGSEPHFHRGRLFWQDLLGCWHCAARAFKLSAQGTPTALAFFGTSAPDRCVVQLALSLHCMFACGPFSHVQQLRLFGQRQETNLDRGREGETV